MKLFAFFALLFAAIPAFAAQSVSIDGLMSLLVYIVVIGLVFWLLWWLLSVVGLPEPFNKVARVVLAVIAVLIMVSFLLGLAGHPILQLR